VNLNLAKIQIQKQTFSASLEQSLAILILPHAELAATIEAELQENPLLEAEASFDTDQFNALASLPSFKAPNNDSLEEDSERESFSMASLMSLEDYLLQQLYWEVSDLNHRKIGEFIIGNLDEDGYLPLSSEEIAKTLNISDINLVRHILMIIQNFEPVGIAALNIKECLIIQLNHKNSLSSDLAAIMIKDHWEDLAHKRYAALAKKLSVSIDEITTASLLIASLEPKPARNYRPLEPTVYVQPDLYILKNEEGEYIIETNRRNIPSLKINQTYRNMLKRPNLSEEERLFIEKRLTNAINFIKNIQQRGSTLTAITRYILEHQKAFFDGQDSSLAPMALKDVAAYLDRCESTISRAVNNKYVETPQGLFPIKFFFSHSVATHNNEDISAHTVKEEIAQLILDEDKNHPLSDLDIQKHFSAKGLNLARRTIAKYRQMLNIPSSHQRNK
jgi:RNA polymerase sigma-54 factor